MSMASLTLICGGWTTPGLYCVRAAYDVTQRSWVGVDTVLVVMAGLLGSGGAMLLQVRAICQSVSLGARRQRWPRNLIWFSPSICCTSSDIHSLSIGRAADDPALVPANCWFGMFDLTRDV